MNPDKTQTIAIGTNARQRADSTSTTLRCSWRVVCLRRRNFRLSSHKAVDSWVYDRRRLLTGTRASPVTRSTIT